MDLIDYLIEDHDKLRAAMFAMERAIQEAESCPPELRTAAMARLKAMQSSFLAALRSHEELESRLLFEALKGMEAGGVDSPEDILHEHDCIHEAFAILSGLIHAGGESDLYSVEFVMARIASNIREHLEQEERGLFPTIRSILGEKSLDKLGRKSEEVRHEG